MFPSPREPNVPADQNAVWRVCRIVFRRAGLQDAPHAHPHTFRHTIIKMLFVLGKNWDQISKWVGHSNPTVTSTVYGRLQDVELTHLMRVPFLASDLPTAADTPQDWRALAELLRRPYHPPPATTVAASPPAPPPPGTTKQMLRLQLEELMRRLLDDPPSTTAS